MRQIVQKGKENADLKTSKNLVEPGDVNRRWCLWGKLLKCEREGLFKQLQVGSRRLEATKINYLQRLAENVSSGSKCHKRAATQAIHPNPQILARNGPGPQNHW